MSSITTLKRSASESATWRGHTLGAWTPDSYWKDTRTASCTVCGASVWVDPKPAPNMIDIHGEAVALNCPAHHQVA